MISLRVLIAFDKCVREYARNRILLVLLAVLPYLFIHISIRVSPNTNIPVRTVVNGLVISRFQYMPDVHGLVMTPITGAFIVGMVGLFLIQSASKSDTRLILTGYEPVELLVSRISVLVLMVGIVTTITIGVMMTRFTPESLLWFILGTSLTILLYGLIGMLVGSIFDKLAGMYLMLFLPLMDIGVFQNPMFFRGTREWWMRLFPGYHSVRVMLDAAFTPQFDVFGHLLWSFVYLFCVALVVYHVYARNVVRK